MEKKFDFLFKLLLIGDSGVGKTCIIFRFVENSFNPAFITTIGIDFKIRTVEIGGKKIKLQIWDTAGQERFHTIAATCYRGAQGIMLVYDVTDEKSFNNIPKWIQKTQELASPNVTKMLIANKCDLNKQRVITRERGEQLAQDQEIRYVEISALSNLNVEDAFGTLTQDVYNNHVCLAAEGCTTLTVEEKAKQACCFH